MEETRISKREQLAKSGEIAAFYGKDYFCKVKPAYGIDKVEFSFVRLNSAGQGFDVYIDMDDFDLLCDDILDMTFARKLLNEKATAENKYPCSFEYITGENGDKKVQICKGQKSDAVIKGFKDGSYSMVGVRYRDLKVMAKWFKRTAESRFRMLSRMTIESTYKPNAANSEQQNDPMNTYNAEYM